jgi:hypothetical protein
MNVDQRYKPGFDCLSSTEVIMNVTRVRGKAEFPYNNSERLMTHFILAQGTRQVISEFTLHNISDQEKVMKVIEIITSNCRSDVEINEIRSNSSK